MRIVTVRIEDNTDKINEIRELSKHKREIEDEITSELDKLQMEGFIQILAYIRCAYEDYIGIVGEITPINQHSWLENRLDVSNMAGTVRICANKNGVFIDFNYMGTLNCCNTPQRMEAIFTDDGIKITKSTRDGIRVLMQSWNSIKPRFQEEIDKVYERKEKEINKEIQAIAYTLEVAKKFKI